MNVSVLTFRDFHGKQAGSSKIRGDWLVKYWPGAELYQAGKAYDVEIFNKVYWTERFRTTPALKILDVCDPDWIDSSQVIEAVRMVDAITCPTEDIKNYLVKLTDTPVKVIPDRLDLELFDKKKVHKGDAKKAVWFGFSHNMGAIQQAIPTLKQFGMKLTIVSDDMRIYLQDLEEKKLFNFVKWDERTAYDEIMRHGEIALLPDMPLDTTGKPPYRHQFKSNNRTITAWALGLPVAKTAEDVEFFIPEKNRQQDAAEKWETVKAHFDVRQSVVEYLELIAEL